MKASFKIPRPPAAVRARLKKIRLFAMDVDGVLTAGDIVVLNSGEEIKLWNVKDRIGLFALKKFSPRFKIAWITGRSSPQVAARAREIGVDALRQNCDHKGRALAAVCEKLGVDLSEALFIGDDLVDLPAFRRAGVAVCPSDAHAAARAVCPWTTRSAGGRGAVREVIDAVLDAQGLTPALLRWFENPDRRPNP
jgi:3-deoxy-D-manno-octulosonate 8-phosphate phosphatase (KDO 8-P phosphatase)